MKIILTGTGSSQNIPAFRCRCNVCSQARTAEEGKYRRKNSSAVVSLSGGKKILIDIPPQFLNQLEHLGIDDLEISHLLLTHRHEDHLLGLFHLLALNPQKGAVIDEPIQIYHGLVTSRYLDMQYKSLTDPERLKLLAHTLKRIRIEELQGFFIGSCCIVPLETNHLKIKSKNPSKCIDESFGYLFSEGGKNFYYLVDAAENLPSETIEYMKMKKPDCIVIDCTYSAAKPSSGHGDLESILSLRQFFPEGRMIISHISHMNHGPDVLTEILSPANVEVGFDGMEIQL